MTNESAILGLLADLYRQNAALAAEVTRLTAELNDRDSDSQPSRPPASGDATDGQPAAAETTP